MNSTPPGFPPWITADGEIDLDKLPIDGILKQTIDLDNFERFRSGCAVLGSMAGGGRLEAGLYLIGLIGGKRAAGRNPARQEFECDPAILRPSTPIPCRPSG